MSTLYTKNGCYPQIIPPIIELENGSTRSNPTTFTAEEIESAGWVLAPEVPEYNISTHILNWDRETSTYVIEAISQEELDRAREFEWRGIREERNLLLAECDYMIIKAFEAGCDLVLHCNGNLKEMNDVAIHSPLINKFIIKKTSQFYKIIS